MESGLLELSTGTIMIMDETTMVAGKIDGYGVENIKSMATLIENQNIIYDFQHYQQEFETSIPV